MRRLVAVHFVPCALFVTCLYAMVRAGSFSGRSDWGAVLPSDPAAAVGPLLLIGSCAAVLGMLQYPFQVRGVRVLEGYWDRWPVTAGLAGTLMELQRCRRHTLDARASAAADAGPNAQRVAADAFRRLTAGPPEHTLLPTALGNALRAGELSAGERYGLTTLASWPHIYMQVSDRMSEVLRSTRDALDTSVNLCWSFLAVGAVLAIALYDEPGVRWSPLLALALAAVAYKGAVVMAQAYSGLMHVVYDLHRFDLLDALHHPLPDKESELDVFGQVSKLFGGHGVPDLPYEHDERRFSKASHAEDADGTTDA
ncbi:hypothetical protein AB0I02_16815 [Streptomyces phaeochromogenes]